MDKKYFMAFAAGAGAVNAVFLVALGRDGLACAMMALAFINTFLYTIREDKNGD